MVNTEWQKVREIFDSALCQKPEERQKYIVAACGADKSLLAEVESLFDSLDSAESFLETPAIAKLEEKNEVEPKTLAKGQGLNHYEIIEQIGTGGMGEVYLAQDKKLDRPVAVKVLNEKFGGDKSNLERFIQEAKAASALNHPNILTIYEFGESDDSHYIVSEYIKGETLREVLKEKTLSLTEILDFAIQITNALCAAHEAHLIHRDIKPENIMVRPDGFAKVLDFGLAKLVRRKNKSILGLDESTLGQHQTAKGVILGTVNYMSPEQAKGEWVDERTDIFSLGVLLYEMIAGQTPFQGNSTSETFANLINAEPKPLSHFAANVPEELQHIVSKMLGKNADERYQTMKNVFTELNNLGENLSLEARLERFAAADALQLLRATGSGANKQTRQTLNALSQSIKQNKPLAAVSLLGLLVCAIALGFYFFKPTNAAVKNKKSIAVLPLKPITANRDDIYDFGIADSLINRLGAMKGFFVRPLSATRQYADVGQDPIAAGREQAVDYVLAANYQLANGRIRVTAQFFNVENGQLEETKIIEKDSGDIFAAQDAIADEVGNLLKTRFADSSNIPAEKRGTTNEEAYRLYLQGKNLIMKRSGASSEKAIGSFEQAIRLDPNYALAYAGLATAYLNSDIIREGGTFAEKAQETERVRATVNKALELDDNVSQAYVVRGHLEMHEFNFAAAEKDLLRAIELEPNNDYAHWVYMLLSVFRGDLDKALTEIETAIAIDPGALWYMQQRGRVLYYSRRYDEAIAQINRAIELDEDVGVRQGWISRAYDLKGDYEAAWESFIRREKSTKRAKKMNPERVEALEKAYETGGWQAVKRKSLEWGENDPSNEAYFQTAIQAAPLGEKEKAFEFLNKAVEQHDWMLYELKVEPMLDSLRDDPRFDQLLRRVGLK